MIIAIASEGNMVAGHFGHCTNFNLVKVENGKIEDIKSIPNPGHKPGFLPNFLNEQGANVIISDGMGGGAVQIFNEHSIEVIVGVEGNIEDVVNEYLKGNLVSTGSICNKHEHHDECGNH